jgi:hypothetical protein
MRNVILSAHFCDGVVMATEPCGFISSIDVRVEVASVIRVLVEGQVVRSRSSQRRLETLIFSARKDAGGWWRGMNCINGVWRDSFVTPNALTRSQPLKLRARETGRRPDRILDVHDDRA